MKLLSHPARYALPFLVALVVVACSPQQPATPTVSLLSELPTPAALPTRAALPTSSPAATPGDATVDAASLSSAQLPSAYVVVSNAELYQQPGGDLLANLSAGERVGLIARSADGGWLHVRYQPLEPTLPERDGWLRSADVTAFTDINALAVAEIGLASEATPTSSEPAATPDAGAITAVVTTDRLNLRAGPGTDQRAVGALSRGEEVQLVGRSDDSAWLQIRTAQGKAGWAAARFLRTSTNLADLPVAGVATTSVPASQPVSSNPATANGGAQGVIVFQTSTGGDIYAINADGTGLRRLTAGIDPSLSPDGSQVAFTRVGGEQGLWVINTDGSGERQLISVKVPRSPSWAPDGSAIIFERNTVDRICRNTPLGCYSDQQIRDAFGGKDCMDFPVGTFCIEDFEVINRKFTGLVRYDMANGTLTDLPGPEIAQSPSHSPTSDSVIFLFREGLAQTTEQGSENPQLLVSFPFLGPAVYSPDGRFLYGSQLSGDHWDVWRWNADGSSPVALTAPPALRDRPIHNVAPAVSPDGKTILFLTDRSGRWELWQMNADSSNQRPFAPEALANIAMQYQFGNERVASWR